MRVFLPVAAAVALALPGCGGPTMAKVKGKVMFDGKTVKDAAVTFNPTGAPGQKETGKPATGFTDADGNFELSTFKNYDGAIVGPHSVHVMIDDTNPAKCRRTKDLKLDVANGPNEFTIQMDTK